MRPATIARRFARIVSQAIARVAKAHLLGSGQMYCGCMPRYAKHSTDRMRPCTALKERRVVARKRGIHGRNKHHIENGYNLPFLFIDFYLAMPHSRHFKKLLLQALRT